MTPTKKHIEQIVTMMGTRLWIESKFLYPTPNVNMSYPYDILDYIKESGLLTEQEIDTALVKGQQHSDEVTK